MFEIKYYLLYIKSQLKLHIMKIDITKASKKMLLKSIKGIEDLRIKYVESEYFEDFYPHIFELFDFTHEQLEEVKYDFIKIRI